MEVPVEDFLSAVRAACMRADAAAARALLARHPGLVDEFTPEDRRVFAQAADEGREASSPPEPTARPRSTVGAAQSSNR